MVAPATADVLARFAQGIANDFLSTLYLATTAPVVVAPAMNVNMWNHPATQANLEILRQRGVRIVEPGQGYLACGMTGAGRLAENETIVAAVHGSAGRRAGSGGRNGAGDGGADAGEDRSGAVFDEPVERAHGICHCGSRAAPRSARAAGERPDRDCRSGRGRSDAGGNSGRDAGGGFEITARSTVVIKTAAVADFRPKAASEQKIKRKGEMTLELEPTADILAEVARRKTTQIVVGFAAETENVLENARKKLASKSLDAIVVNDVSREGVGFDSDRNAVTIISQSEVVEVPETSKWEVAHRVLDQVVKLRKRTAIPPSTLRSDGRPRPSGSKDDELL